MTISRHIGLMNLSLAMSLLLWVPTVAYAFAKLSSIGKHVENMGADLKRFLSMLETRQTNIADGGDTTVQHNLQARLLSASREKVGESQRKDKDKEIAITRNAGTDTLSQPALARRELQLKRQKSVSQLRQDGSSYFQDIADCVLEKDPDIKMRDMYRSPFGQHTSASKNPKYWGWK